MFILSFALHLLYIDFTEWMHLSFPSLTDKIVNVQDYNVSGCGGKLSLCFGMAFIDILHFCHPIAHRIR